MTDDVRQRKRALEDAQARLDRYRRTCLLLGSGTAAAVSALVGCAFIVSSGFGSVVGFVAVPAAILGAACIILLIFAVVDVHAYNTRHPADAVRAAQHAYDDALDAEAVRLIKENPS